MKSPARNSTSVPSASMRRVTTETIPAAMSAAQIAQGRWALTPLATRLALIRELRRLIAENAAALSQSSAVSRHRPALESLTAEVLPLAEACRFLEREARRLLGVRRLGRSSLPLWLSGIRREIRREPLGVVLVIGPGNYPLFLAGVQVIQALVAGNAVLFKPGVGGTASALVLLELIVRAGFDSQLVWLLPESTEAARAAIDERPDKVLFTGSAATGEKILQQLAGHLIPATMELSGSDPVVVRADADLDLVVKALVFGLTLNAGATCLAPRRVFVNRSIATELEGRLAQAFPIELSQRIGHGHAASVRPKIEEALAAGVHLIAGGLHKDGTILAPVVLGGSTATLRLLQEDLFAPVLIVVTVANDYEAVALANDCPFALGASVFTRDHAAAGEIATRLQAGVVSINDLIIPTADANLPFGGRKRSGFGVTRGAEGLLELTVPKVITVSRSKFRPAFDPPHPKDEAMFHAYLKLAHGRSVRQRVGALVTLGKSLFARIKSSRQSTL